MTKLNINNQINYKEIPYARYTSLLNSCSVFHYRLWISTNLWVIRESFMLFMSSREQSVVITRQIPAKPLQCVATSFQWVRWSIEPCLVLWNCFCLLSFERVFSQLLYEFWVTTDRFSIFMLSHCWKVNDDGILARVFCWSGSGKGFCCFNASTVYLFT